MFCSLFFVTSILGALLHGSQAATPLQSCPGYKASSVKYDENSLTADLSLAGEPCNTYGTDLGNLKLRVDYETDSRLHVMIYDANEEVYQVPNSIFPRPSAGQGSGAQNSTLKFDLKEDPFSFTVSRSDTGEVLFDTSSSNLVFQSQYLKFRTSLPKDPNLYGLGEHSDPLRLLTTSYTRTFWNRDAYGIPPRTNLYGDHPIYLDHRGKSGTHAVLLLNSNGMDIKIDKTSNGSQYLEYNILGGVVDLYFFAGPTPKEVLKQYALVAGFPAMVSYWTFGFHQCRYGYHDIYEVAEVVYNYSQAQIPLETMWTDIDYMRARITFTTDPERFPVSKIRELVAYLHDHYQHYIMMVDPAMSVSDNGAFNRGQEDGIFMKNSDGSIYHGVVWPGVTAFPDWFNSDTQGWWNNEFNIFFSPDTGVDIDGLWIDMNEASQFCPFPCSDPAGWASANNFPPAPQPVTPNPRPLPGFPPDFQPSASAKFKRQASVNGQKIGLPGRDLLNPPYTINNTAGVLSQYTINTNLIHAGDGYAEYDTHNLYGTMMSSSARIAMLQRRPTVRPLVITRSTFVGAGAHVGHWLGDNWSDWDHYRVSIPQMLAFASIFHVPMVGSDVCGFGKNTTENLCARWATLGAFYPFYRNHNELGSTPQEFYRWPTVAEAARKAIAIRYRLLDYIYTDFYRQSTTGEPFLQPLFYLYPQDNNTFPIDRQFFFGDAVLVSPVMDDGSTSVDAYFPDDIFYDWYTLAPVRGNGANMTLSNINITDIPLHIRGGTIIPTRASGANTTTELRKQNFNVIIAPGLDGTAVGSLYIDDGNSLEQNSSLEVDFKFENGQLDMRCGPYFDAGVVIETITLLGQETAPSGVRDGNNNSLDFQHDSSRKVVVVKVSIPFNGPTTLSFA